MATLSESMRERRRQQEAAYNNGSWPVSRGDPSTPILAKFVTKPCTPAVLHSSVHIASPMAASTSTAYNTPRSASDSHCALMIR